MNKLYSIILFSLTLITLVLADIPQKISYQGILLNSETGELLEGAYDLTFKLYDSESNELWSETQSSELTGGVFNILLGSITSLELPFDQPYFMGITVNDDPELSPRIELSSSAYSFTTGSILGGVAVKSINDLKDDILITGGENVTVAQSGNSLIISSNALGDSDNDWVRVGDTLYSAPDSTVTIRNGKVGIGKQNPTLFRLEVESEMLPGATLSADALFQNRSGMGGGLAIMTGDSIGVLVATSMEDTDMNIGFMPKESGSPHVEAMRISSNGNVGIGTVTPSSKLEVAGDDSTTTIDINNSLYNGGISQVRFKSFGMPRYSLGLDHTNSSYGKFKIGMTTPANNTLLTIDAGGNVGIGTTSPSTKLEVAGQVKITGGSPGSGKVLTSDGTGLASWQTPTGGGGADSDWTVSGNNMYSQPSGNIGIGTTTPGVKFDVSGKIRSNEAIHVLHSSGNASTFEVSSNDLFIHNSSAGEIGFGTSTFSSQSIRRLTIKNDGNVGIGTVSPGVKLDVSGKIRSNEAIHVLHPSGNASTFEVSSNDLFIHNSSAGEIGFGTSTFNSQSIRRLTIKNDGNVGIGTDTPSTKLEVAGQVKITGGSPGSGKVLTSDGTGLASWQTPTGGGGADSDWTVSGNNMYSQPSGNVGIGTTAPTRKLHVHDSAPTSAVKFTNPVTGLLTNDGLEIGTTGQMAQVWNYENGPIRFGTNNDFRMIIEDSGRVAIGGNFSAASTVHIHDSAPTSAVKFTNPVTGLSTNDGLEIGATGQMAQVWNYENGPIRFGTNNDFRMIIGSDGNVAIGGNFTATEKLEVNGNIKLAYNNAGTKILVGSDELISAQYGLIKLNGGPDSWSKVSIPNGNVGIGTDTPSTKLEVAGQVKITGGSPGSGKVLTSDANGLATWQTTASGADSDWTVSGNNMYSQPSGNVGIGTNSPYWKLSVLGTIGAIDSSNNTIEAITYAENKAGVLGSTATSNGFGVWGSADNSGVGVYGYSETGVAGKFVSNSTAVAGFFSSAQGHGLIVENGNVGFGTASPSHPLHMSSGAYVSSGGVWTNASSRSLKENIFDLSLHDALKALKNIKPVTFNYKNQKDEKYAGFIAEDVPDLVAMNDRTSLSSMDIVAVLTKVLQEQQRINQDQQKEIDALKAQIDQIYSPEPGSDKKSDQ